MPAESRDVRHVVVTFGAGRFWVAYRRDLRDGPISVLPVLLDDPGSLPSEVHREQQAEQIVDQVCRLVESWDLETEANVPIPLAADAVRRVPLLLLQIVLDKIVRDLGAELEVTG